MNSRSSSPTAEPAYAAVITAAGTGRRMGGCKKPFLTVGGMTLLDRSLRQFRAAGGCEQLVVVVHPSDLEDDALAQRLLAEYGVGDLIPGGETRQDSSRAGIQAVRQGIPLVLVHDAVRPFVRPDVICSVARVARAHGAAIAAVPARETIKMTEEDGRIVETPPRERLWCARTPQGFRRKLILQAHEWAARAGFQGTDDAQLVERLGRAVYVVRDNYDNIKITTPEDLPVAEAILRRQRGEPG